MTRRDYLDYCQRVADFLEAEGVRNLTTRDAEAEPYTTSTPCPVCRSTLMRLAEDCSGYNPTTGEVREYDGVCCDCVYYCEYGRLPDAVMDAFPEPGHYTAADAQKWRAPKLKDYADFADNVEFRRERESGYGDAEGEWFYGDDENCVLYSGTHGNDHSPGASHYTYAEVYETVAEYESALEKWDAKPEYLDEDLDEDEENS